MNKIYGDHTRSAAATGSLCGTCRHLTVIRGESAGDTLLRCKEVGGRIAFQVTECSAYDDAREPPLQELYQRAWRLFEMPRTGERRWVSPAEFYRLSADDD